MSGHVMDSMWTVIPQIKTPLALASFAIAALTLIARTKGDKKLDPTTIVIVFAIVLVGLAALFFDWNPQPRAVTYDVRVTTLDAENRPIEGAKVRTTVSSELQTAGDGSVTLSIPIQSLPQDKHLTIYGTVNTLYGETEIVLKDDPKVSVTLHLKPDIMGSVQGIVEDEHGQLIEGASVTVVGGASSTTTNKQGQFNLDGVGPKTGEVRLHVEKAGFEPLEDYYQIGNPAAIKLAGGRSR